jgi:hypothetical protein
LIEPVKEGVDVAAVDVKSNGMARTGSLSSASPETPRLRWLGLMRPRGSPEDVEDRKSDCDRDTSRTPSSATPRNAVIVTRAGRNGLVTASGGISGLSLPVNGVRLSLAIGPDHRDVRALLGWAEALDLSGVYAAGWSR